MGVDAPLVTVKVHLSNGLPAITYHQVPVSYGKRKQRSCSRCITQFWLPISNRRVTTNLAPTDLPKEGGRFDLPIALGILAATDQLPHESLHGYEFLGELSLSGQLRSVHGVLPAAVTSGNHSRSIVVPINNGGEALHAK